VLFRSGRSARCGPREGPYLPWHSPTSICDHTGTDSAADCPRSRSRPQPAFAPPSRAATGGSALQRWRRNCRTRSGPCNPDRSAASVRQMMSAGSGLLTSPRTDLDLYAASCSAKACGVLNSRNGFSTSQTRSAAEADVTPHSDNVANAIRRKRMPTAPQAAAVGMVLAVSWIAAAALQPFWLTRQFPERLIAIGTILSILPIIHCGSLESHGDSMSNVSVSACARGYPAPPPGMP